MTVRLVFQAIGILKGRPEDKNEAVPVEEQA